MVNKGDKQYKSNYYKDNRERLLEYQRIYTKMNKIKLKIYSGEPVSLEEKEEYYEYKKMKINKKLKLGQLDTPKIKTGNITVSFD